MDRDVLYIIKTIIHHSTRHRKSNNTQFNQLSNTQQKDSNHFSEIKFPHLCI